MGQKDDAALLRETYALLLGMYRNLPEQVSVPTQHMDDFHGVLQDLQAAGYDMHRFRVPGHHVNRNRVVDNTSYSGAIRRRTRLPDMVDRSALAARMEAVVSLFEIERQPVGFRLPKEAG
jgi:hypothetical protein